MPHIIDQAGLIEGLLIEQRAQVSTDLLFIGIIGDVLFHVFKHVHNLDIGTAVAGTLQGTQGGSDGGIGICPGRGNHMGGKGRVVSAAVFRVEMCIRDSIIIAPSFKECKSFFYFFEKILKFFWNDVESLP